MTERQVMRFPLGAGIDVKSDAKHVPIPKLEELVNVDLRTDGAVKKRRALKATSDGGAGDVATLVGGNRRFLVDADVVNGSVIKINGTTRPGATALCAVSTSQVLVAKKSTEYRWGHCASQSGVLCTVVAGSIGEVDPDLGVFTSPGYPDDQPATGGGVAKVRATPGHGFLCVWGETANVKAQFYSGGAFVGSSVTLVADLYSAGAGSTLDVIVNAAGTKAWLAYRFNTGSGIQAKVVDFTISGGGTIAATGNSELLASTGGDPDLGIALALDDLNSNLVVVTSSTTVSESSHWIADDDLLQTFSRFSLGAVTNAPSHRNVLAVSLGSGKVMVGYTIGHSGFSSATSVVTSVITELQAKSNERTIYGAAFAHEAIAVTLPVMVAGSPDPFVVFGVVRGLDDYEAVYLSLMVRPTQSKSYPVVIASYQYGTANPPNATDYPDFNLSSIAEVATDTGYRYFWSASIRNELRVTERLWSTVQSNLSAGLHSFDLSPDKMFSHAHAHDALVVAGSVPMAVVGDAPLYAGHICAPTILSVVVSAGAGLSIGDYIVSAVYEFLDQAGRVWQSRPSVVSTFTTTSGNLVATVNVAHPVTARQDSATATPLQIALYVTKVGGTIKYRATATPYSGTAVDWHTALHTGIVVTNPAGDEQVLYTESTELEHFPPPPCTSIVKHKNRFFAIHAETGDIWPSLQFVEGQGIHWNPALAIKCDDPADKPTALASTDAALVVMHRNRAGHIYGDGPNNQGLGQPFSNVQFLPDADVGAISQKTMVKIPSGLFFCDPDKGFHVLPYGGGIPTPVGRDMDGAPGLSAGNPAPVIIGTVHLPDRQEVRVVYYDALAYEASDGEEHSATWWTYHYDKGQWSYGLAADFVASNLYAVADGNEFILSGVGEDASPGYDGASTFVTMRLRTGWMVMSPPDRRQGLFRLWTVNAFIQGGGYGSDLKVVLWFDHDTGAEDEKVYGDYAGTDLQIWPNRQLVSAFKLLLEDAEAATSGTAGADFTISDIEIHFGIYPANKGRHGTGAVLASNRPRVAPP